MPRLVRKAALPGSGFTKVANRLVTVDPIYRVPSAAEQRMLRACWAEHDLDVTEQARQDCADILTAPRARKQPRR